MKSRSHKVWYAPLLLACGAALLLFSLAAIALLVWLRPAAQDWQRSVQLGPFALHVSVEKALRLASHHTVAAALLDGRSVQTAAGAWRISVGREETTLICAPCLLAHQSLGPGSIKLDRVLVRLKPDRDGYSGLVRLHAGGHEIALPWTSRVGAQAAIIDASATAIPMAELFAVLGHDLPEVQVATITGHLSLQMRFHLPQRRMETQWTVEEFSVAGLGTQRLLNASPPENCGGPMRQSISGWLPKAVIAAEDQAFRDHAGFDARQINAALRSNAEVNTLHGASLRGASTLTQQLARLLYTGGERTVQRKLRELLYAVEMEQTLGKARILQLYLTLAPWGRGVCGAENAAQRYLGKPANALTPAEAAWLAGLLTNPDAQLRQVRASGVDATRTGHIVQAIRPMSMRRRARAMAEIASLKPSA